MKNLKTAMLILCLLAGAFSAGTGPRAYAERVTEKKTPEATPAAETLMPPEEEAAAPEGDGEADATEEAGSPNGREEANIPLSKEAARDARVRRSYPFLIGIGITNVMLFVFALLLDRFPVLAEWILGIGKQAAAKASGEGNRVFYISGGNAGKPHKAESREMNPDTDRRIRQLEEWKKSGLISRGEYRKLKKLHTDAQRSGRGGEP